MSLITISTTSTSTTSPLVTFNGMSTSNYNMYPQLNDGTLFTWDVTTPVSSSLWTGCFGDTASSLPSKYLNINVMTNQSSYTWAWPSVTGTTQNTFSMPTGVITLGTIMSTLYTATSALISASQYQDITGVPYTGTQALTIAKALRDNSINNGSGGTVTWNALSFETPTRIRYA